MKGLGYQIFAVLYRIFCLFPVNQLDVFLIMTHDAGPEGNVGVVRAHMEELKEGYRFHVLKRTDTHFGKSIKKIWKFFVMDAYHLARSRYVFLDNMFLPMAYMKFRKGVEVVQLWHGTGVIKKIGADANEGMLKDLEQRANANNTHLIVSSEITREIYQKSFSMDAQKVHMIGMPRSDVFFDLSYQKRALEQFYAEFPMCKGKRLVLYAPTFRDCQVKHPKIELDIQKMVKELPEDCVLGLRLHPFVARAFMSEHKELLEQIPCLNFGSYKSLNTLLFATDCLITDYSSIIFDYSALKKPMVFYAYDLEDFEKNSRGFYCDYEQYVPGPVCRTQDELMEQVKLALGTELKQLAEMYGWDAFLKQTFAYQDSESTKRLMQLLKIEQ